MYSNINSLIQKPESLDKQSLAFLGELLEKYPFFQTARLLHIKNIQNIYSQIDKDELNLTATYVSDRKTLYYLLHKLPAKPWQKEEKTKLSSQSAVGKEIKDSLQENISDTINNQLSYYNMAPSAEIELISGLAIDIRKEYGEGIVLDNRIYSVNRPSKHSTISEEVFELDGQSEDIYKEEATNDEIDLRPSSTDLIEFESKPSDPSNVRSIIQNEEVSDKITKSTTQNSEKKASEADTDVNNESLSFTSWLNVIDDLENKTAITRQGKDEPEISSSSDRKNDNKDIIEGNIKNIQGSLIDKFIETNPRIVPHAENIKNEDISGDSVKEHESFFTDTLAQIYIKQGHYAKAIFAYEKLSLKYPEKSTYFAGQISVIKKLINNS